MSLPIAENPDRNPLFSVSYAPTGTAQRHIELINTYILI